MLNNLNKFTYRIRSHLGQTSRSLSRYNEESIKSKWNLDLSKAVDGRSFSLKLNNIAVRTPLKNPFIIENEALALAILNEWKNREEKPKRLDLPRMHLTTLANEVIDNPFNETDRDITKAIISYLEFDTLRFRDVGNEQLMDKQARHWDPMIGWFEHQFDSPLPVDYGEIMTSISVPRITIEKIDQKLSVMSRWSKVGLRFVAQSLKSFVLTSSITQRFLTVEQAVDLARLETQFQVEKWSKVEWEHDLEEQSTLARTAAGSLFYHLSAL